MSTCFFIVDHSFQTPFTFMPSMLSSHGLVLVTAMAISAGTLILLDLLREKYSTTTTVPRNQDSIPGKQILRPCLTSGSKKRDGKKKKKVQFADDVKDSSGNGEEYRKEKKKVSRIQNISCGNEILEIPEIPANRVALYSGKLKDRLQRMECSY